MSTADRITAAVMAVVQEELDRRDQAIAHLRAALTTISQEAPPYASGVRSYAEAVLAGEEPPRSVCWIVSLPPTDEDYRIAEEIARKRNQTAAQPERRTEASRD